MLRTAGGVGGFVIIGVLIAIPALAQTSAPTDFGVRMGHWQLNTTDVEATKQMLVAMGGRATMAGEIEVVVFPDVTVHLHLGGHGSPPTGGTAVSVVDHVGLNVQNLDESLARWQAAGVPVEHSGAPFPQAWVVTPDGLRIEILQTRDQEHPIQHHHVHYFVPESDIPVAQQWYAEVFGAVPGMRGNFQAADIPGANLTFSATDRERSGTRGGVLDHVGFQVEDLGAFCQRMDERSDVELDQPCERNQRTGQMTTFLYDPWGTYLAVTEWP